MYGDYDAQLRGDTPSSEALTRGDVLFWVACFVAGWMAVIGVVGTLYHASLWLMGKLA